MCFVSAVWSENGGEQSVTLKRSGMYQCWKSNSKY